MIKFNNISQLILKLVLVFLELLLYSLPGFIILQVICDSVVKVKDNHLTIIIIETLLDSKLECKFNTIIIVNIMFVLTYALTVYHFLL